VRVHPGVRSAACLASDAHRQAHRIVGGGARTVHRTSHRGTVHRTVHLNRCGLFTLCLENVVGSVRLDLAQARVVWM
jgi:hypothetical protein